jgi:hydroxyacylglutathione hydrolase
MTVNLHVAHALKDNYVYVLEDTATRRAVVVDPGEAHPAIEVLDRLGLSLAAVWCTHHHGDHVGGVTGLLACWPKAEVLGSGYDGAHDRIPGQTRRLGDGDVLEFAGQTGRAMAIPGHTLGHVAYLIGGQLFPGDTLFGSGCGRLFEGTPADMHHALSRLRALPDETRVWCGHEYTLMNLRYAVEIDPTNTALRARHAAAEAQACQPTIPLSLAEERATNPFLRWDAAALRAWSKQADDVAVFAAVRTHRNGWQNPSPIALERRPFVTPAW